MSEASVQEVRAVLAKWTANDWRRGFALAPVLENTLRRACDLHQSEPILNGSGALAMPVRTKLERLPFEELLEAIAPLLLRLETRLNETAGEAAGEVPAALGELETQDDIGAGLAKLAALRLGLEPSIATQPFGPAPGAVSDRVLAVAGHEAENRDSDDEPGDLSEVVTTLQQEQRLVVAAAERIVADVTAGVRSSKEDLALVTKWNDGLARAASLAGTDATSLADLSQSGRLRHALREIAEAPMTDGARAVLAATLDEAATVDPETLDADRQEAFLALHGLLSTASWAVDDDDVDVVEAAFGRKVARVAVAEVALG